MKVPGLVTIMVPVLNGELFLPLALDPLLRLRALIGRALVLLRLKEGPPVMKYIHFEKWVTTLQEVGYCPPTSGREETQSQMKP